MKFPRNKSCNYNFRSKLGASIGKGRTREVFNIKDNPKYVIKFSSNPDTNRHEYKFYKEAKHNKLTAVLNTIGEIISISKSGQYLVMEKLNDLPVGNHTTQCPAEITDRKRSNFGVDSKGVIKARDYDTRIGGGASGKLTSVVFSQDDQDYFRNLLDDLDQL
ncbi:hypothetical protein NL53_14400 [Vibrio variabilis]|uniref:Uncharacterized protein n=1 Tax=Vibrio variabilis TaxID=990271 RepID=A0ABR4YA81_9VIBR|nr:hypothetical protein [Vibrio variabilis]KHA59862.1 hypothetical protein NL53_14400 [Vibrio variabilis]